MPLGPGKYDDLATLVVERVGTTELGGGVVVIVLGGNRGSGFSVQADLVTTVALPAILENVAAEIRRSTAANQ